MLLFSPVFELALLILCLIGPCAMCAIGPRARADRIPERIFFCLLNASVRARHRLVCWVFSFDRILWGWEFGLWITTIGLFFNLFAIIIVLYVFTNCIFVSDEPKYLLRKMCTNILSHLFLIVLT